MDLVGLGKVEQVRNRGWASFSPYWAAIHEGLLLADSVEKVGHGCHGRRVRA